MRFILKFGLVLVLAILAAGCTSTLRLNFAEPRGSRVWIAGYGENRMPFEMTMRANAKTGKSGGQAFSITAPSGQEFKGRIYVMEIIHKRNQFHQSFVVSLSKSHIWDLEHGRDVRVSIYAPPPNRELLVELEVFGKR